MGIKLNFNSNNKVNYNVSNDNTNRPLNNNLRQNNPLNIKSEMFRIDVNEEAKDATMNELDSLDGLSDNYKNAVAESVAAVVSKKSGLSQVSMYLNSDSIIKYLDEIEDELRNRGYNISPLINSYINKLYPDSNIKISEEFAIEFINFLYNKNSNFDNKKPYILLKDILSKEDDIDKIVGLIDFLQKANNSIDLSYSNLCNNIEGFESFSKNLYKDSLSKFLLNFRFYDSKIYDETIDKMWDYVILKNGTGVYQLLNNYITDFDEQLISYLSMNGINISSIDSKEAITNILNDITQFNTLLKKIPTASKIKIKNIKDINNLLIFIGVEKLGEKIRVINDNISKKIIHYSDNEAYNDLIHSIENGTFTGGLISPDYHPDTTITTTTVAK